MGPEVSQVWDDMQVAKEGKKKVDASGRRQTLEATETWRGCVALLDGAAFVPRLRLRSVRMKKHGGVTADLEALPNEPVEHDACAAELRQRLRQCAGHLGRDGFELCDRHWHMTLAYPRGDGGPMPEDVREAVRQAVERCFGMSPRPIPLRPAALCLSPDMTRFVPWDGLPSCGIASQRSSTREHKKSTRWRRPVSPDAAGDQHQKAEDPAMPFSGSASAASSTSRARPSVFDEDAPSCLHNRGQPAVLASPPEQQETRNRHNTLSESAALELPQSRGETTQRL